MIGNNLDTCRRGPPLIKLIGYEYREDALGLGGAGNDKHTRTHTHTVFHGIHMVDETSGKNNN